MLVSQRRGDQTWRVHGNYDPPMLVRTGGKTNMAAIPSTTPETKYVAAFLDIIGWSEGTSTSPITLNEGYDIIVSGIDGKERFSDFSQHPFATGRPAKQINHANPPLTSTASGRYQFLLRTWRAYETILHLPDFSPLSQDLAVVRIIEECEALDHIRAGEIETAIYLCAHIWASFPKVAGGGTYTGQNAHPIATLLAQWEKIWSESEGINAA